MSIFIESFAFLSIICNKLSSFEITKAFNGQNEGGIRISKATNTLHLISDHTKISPYKDKFDDDRVYYCGMGQTDDQSLNAAQNKTLNESNINGVDVFNDHTLDWQ